MQNLLTYAYWFSLLPAPLLPWAFKLLTAVFSALVAVGIALRGMAAKNPASMYWAKGGAALARLFLWMGAIGLILVWFTTEQAYFFGARFWFMAWGATFLVWLVLAVRYVTKTIPKQAADFAEKARIGKYLPKNN